MLMKFKPVYFIILLILLVSACDVLDEGEYLGARPSSAYAGYFIQNNILTFYFDEDIYKDSSNLTGTSTSFLVDPSRVMVSGEFNAWSTQYTADWNLEQFGNIWILSKSLSLFSDGMQFKFRSDLNTDNNGFLQPPNNATNTVSDGDSGENLVINLNAGFSNPTNTVTPIPPSPILPTQLSNNIWYNEAFNTENEKFYQFNCETGKIYKIFWDDSYSGSGTQSVDVYVSAYRQNLQTPIFTRVDSGYNSPQTVSGETGETILIKVSSYSSGSFRIKVEDVTISTDKKVLSYRVVDAEYSKQLNKIIMVSANPNKLHIYDPETNTEESLDLPTTPNCVSVGPDGLSVAVGYNAWVSYIDLQILSRTTSSAGIASISKNIATTTDVLDVVLAGNGYIYAFPRRDQWEEIRCINISTSVETLMYGIYAGTKAKLHPDGNSIYGADNGLSPSDIEKYDITSGTATMLYDSPYHGDFSMAGDLWMSEDGMRIFTRSGNVFRSSAVVAEDMTYNGSLPGASGLISLCHSSMSGKVAVIPQDDTGLMIFEYAFLNYETKYNLPFFLNNGQVYAGHGKYVFVNSGGNKYYVIMQADSVSGLLYDYAITSF